MVFCVMWYVVGIKKLFYGIFYMYCNVKLGVSKNCEGVVLVGEDVVEICVVV